MALSLRRLSSGLMLRNKEGCGVGLMLWCIGGGLFCFGRMLLKLFGAFIGETCRTAVICNKANSVFTGTKQGFEG